MLTSDLRDAIGRAAGVRLDPGLRLHVTAGVFSSTVPFTLAVGRPPAKVAAELASKLSEEPWIESVDVTGPGYLTITVTRQALEEVPSRIVAAGQDCVRSDALAGAAVPSARDPRPDGWDHARDVLAAELTARLAHAAGAAGAAGAAAGGAAGAAGATPNPGTTMSHRRPSGGVDVTSSAIEWAGKDIERAAVAWAGEDAVRFALARTPPGRHTRIDQDKIARHVLANPAYAVRYAHSRAASVPRWATAPQRDGSLEPEELVLASALSWLPERVAMAARRGRPDEFARYLEGLANCVIVRVSPASNLELAAAARTGLAAGLGLLGIGAPDRLLGHTERETA